MTSVDVIVPCYLYGRYLRECVESVLSETTLNIRVLIIDDASPDDTAEVAADLMGKDPRVIFLKHTINKGHIATYNEGIEWVSADYMLLLSADDYLLPGALSRAVALMDSYPDVGFIFGNAIYIDDDGTIIKSGPKSNNNTNWRILKGLEFIKLHSTKNDIATPTVVIRTKLQKQMGGYRAELPHSGDMEMWLRLAAHTSVGFLETNQAVRRYHPTSMHLTYNGLADFQQRKAALDCFFKTCDYITDVRQVRCILYWNLSLDTIKSATITIIIGEMELSEQLSEFALNVYPAAKKSLWWKQFACIRFLAYILLRLPKSYRSSLKTIATVQWRFILRSISKFRKIRLKFDKVKIIK